MTNKDNLIDRMVDKFLSMPMPRNFSPDGGGIKFDRTYSLGMGSAILERKFQGPHWPIGTNLFDAEQARELFSILLEGEDLPAKPVQFPKTPFATDLDTVINELREILLEKNRKYGDSALTPAVVALFFMDRADLYFRRYLVVKLILEDIFAKGKVTKEHRTRYKEMK